MAESVYVPSTLKEGYFADLPAPVAGDDARPITYNHATLSFVYSSAFATAAQVATVASNLNTHANLTNGAHGISTFGASLVDDADQATARATLGLVIGTNIQAYNANLAALAGLTGAADKLGYFTGVGALALADFTTVGRNVVAATTQALARTALGLGTIATAADTAYLLATGATVGATIQRQSLQFGLSAGKAGFSGSLFDGIDADGNIGMQIRGSLNLHNTYIGASSGVVNTTGSENVFVGGNAGLSNLDGAINVFLGYNAGRNNTSGSYNVFVGNGAGRNTTTGTANVLIGISAGSANTTGSQLIFVGSNAGLSNTTGVRNLFIGDSAGRVNTSGNYNVFFGADAGRLNTTGGENTAIGTDAGRSNVTGNSSTFLGYSAGYNETGSNKLYIANSATTTPLIYGDFSTGLLTVHTADAGTNTVVNTLSLNRLSSGTPAAGFGTALRAQLESSTTESQDAGRIAVRWNDATHATRHADMVFSAWYTSTEREFMRGRAGSAAPMIGFLGATPIAKPTITGSRGGNAALADFLTQFANYGLITDSTTV